jgi:hypothetical protein
MVRAPFALFYLNFRKSPVFRDIRAWSKFSLGTRLALFLALSVALFSRYFAFSCAGFALSFAGLHLPPQRAYMTGYRVNAL